MCTYMYLYTYTYTYTHNLHTYTYTYIYTHILYLMNQNNINKLTPQPVLCNMSLRLNFQIQYHFLLETASQNYFYSQNKR